MALTFHLFAIYRNISNNESCVSYILEAVLFCCQSITEDTQMYCNGFLDSLDKIYVNKCTFGGQHLPKYATVLERARTTSVKAQVCYNLTINGLLCRKR